MAGAGPAGHLAARACARAGLSVAWVAPALDPWTARYGLWVDEAADLPDVALARTWTTTAAYAPEPRNLGRAYARLDHEATAARWAAAAEDAGAERIHAAVTRFRAGGVDTDGGPLGARVVVDATGARAGATFQTAYGIAATVAGHPFGDAAVLMDWRGDGRSFLYALPAGPDEIFLEETVLRGPPIAHDALRERLARRLDALGVVVRQVHAEERCTIPLDAPRRHPPGGVALGAAGGMVHPVSGYLLPRVARAAEAVARAIVEGADPRAAAWSAGDRVRARLHAVAARFLDATPPDELPDWFDTFFAGAGWRSFLSPVAPPADVAKAMAGLFASAPSRARARMLLSALRATRAPETA